MTTPLITTLLFVAALMARCGGDGAEPVTAPAEVPAPISGQRDIQTTDYLDEAVLPGTFFRWTPSLGSSVIDVPIEIHDGAGELPARLLADGMTPEEIERQVREVVAIWAAEASKAGVEVRPEFAFHAKGEDFASDPRAQIHLRFRSPATGTFSGLASLTVWSSAPEVVLHADIEITVPTLAGRISLDGYRSLLAHEFGHAFGIISEAPASGHSPDGNDVMYPVAQWSTLSDGDRTAMQELYRRTPDLVRTSGQTPFGPPRDGAAPAHRIEAFRHRCSSP